MPQPLITWVILALILGILIGAALNERWHTRNDQHDEHNEHERAVAHRWGEIDAAATRAARGAGAFMYEGLRADPKVQAIMDDITAGLRQETERRFREAAALPLLTVSCDRLGEQDGPFLFDDRLFEAFVGAPRTAILYGLGFADGAG